MKSFIFVIVAIATCVLAPSPVSAQWIYWADNDADTINRLDINGGESEVLIHTEPNPQGLAIDTFAGKMYWSDIGNSRDSQARGKIYGASLDGSEIELLYAAPLPHRQELVGQIALDLPAEQLYWTDESGDRIRRMNLDGTGVEVVLGADSSLGTGLEIDPVNRHLYFTTGSSVAGTAKIERADLDGSNRNVIADVYGFSISLDVENEQIYAADFFDDRILGVAFDGTEISNVVPSVLAPRDVQVFQNQLYYPNITQGTDGTGEMLFFWQWVRSELDGTDPVVLYEVPRSQGPLDMVQFVVVPVSVPEPTSFPLLGFAMFSMSRRRRRLS